MLFGAFIGKAAGLVATGLAGAAAHDGAKKIVKSGVVHNTAVTVTA